MTANWYVKSESTFCDMAEEDEEGEVEEFDPADARTIAEEQEAATAADNVGRLDAFSHYMKGRDAELFKILGRGLTLHEAAEEMGSNYDAIKQRLSRLRRRFSLVSMK